MDFVGCVYDLCGNLVSVKKRPLAKALRRQETKLILSKSGSHIGGRPFLVFVPLRDSVSLRLGVFA
jgi:hypothetical protein